MTVEVQTLAYCRKCYMELLSNRPIVLIAACAQPTR